MKYAFFLRFYSIYYFQFIENQYKQLYVYICIKKVYCPCVIKYFLSNTRFCNSLFNEIITSVTSFPNTIHLYFFVTNAGKYIFITTYIFAEQITKYINISEKYFFPIHVFRKYFHIHHGTHVDMCLNKCIF